MAGPAHWLVHGPGGSDGPDQGRGPDQDAQRVTIPDRVVPVQWRIGGYRGASGAGGRREAMNDDTRKLLKVFGVAVTDAEAETEQLAGTAAQLAASGSARVFGPYKHSAGRSTLPSRPRRGAVNRRCS